MGEAAPTNFDPGGGEIGTPGRKRRYYKPVASFRLGDIKALLGESFEEWVRHRGPRLGAALAFYTLLSLTPLLLIAISIGGLVFGSKVAESQVVWQIQDLIGRQGANGIQALLEGTP